MHDDTANIPQGSSPASATPAAPAPKGASRVRPMERADLEKIAHLFLRTFRSDSQAGRPGEVENLAAYLDQLYLQGPHSGEGVNSLVYAGPGGDIGGFLGLHKTHYALEGRRLSTCMIGSLMSARDPVYSRAGAQLLWGLNDLEFDIVMTDSANRRSLAFTGPLKYEVMSVNCLEWTFAFKPASMVIYKVRQRWPSIPSALMRPLEKAGDYVARRAIGDKLTAPTSKRHTMQTTDSAGFATAVQSLADSFRLRPEWPFEELTWILARAEETRRHGPLNYCLVHDRSGACIGCYAFYGETGLPAKTLQILAANGCWGATLESLLHAAQEMGCIGVIGQAQDALMSHLFKFSGVIFYYTGGSFVRSKDQDVIDLVHRQGMLIGGLAGDRWTRLSSGEI